MLPNLNQSPNVMKKFEISFFLNLAIYFRRNGNPVTDIFFFFFFFSFWRNFPPKNKVDKKT
jgi:hypothetical protein